MDSRFLVAGVQLVYSKKNIYMRFSILIKSLCTANLQHITKFNR